MLKPFPLHPEKMGIRIRKTSEAYQKILKRCAEENIPISRGEAIANIEIYLDYKLRVMPFFIQYVDSPVIDHVKKCVDKYYKTQDQKSKSKIQRVLGDMWADLFSTFQKLEMEGVLD